LPVGLFHCSKLEESNGGERKGIYWFYCPDSSSGTVELAGERGGGLVGNARFSIDYAHGECSRVKSSAKKGEGGALGGGVFLP